MKILISAWIALIFLLIWMYNSQWGFNFWILYLFGIEDLGGADFWWVQKVVNKSLLIPDIINAKNSQSIYSFLNEYFNITKNWVYLWIIFIFYFCISLFPLLINMRFNLEKDKKSFTIIYIISYIILLIAMK